MSEKPIVNPSIPYLGPLQSTFAPGKFVRIIGTVSSIGKEFFCNFQCGPNNYEDVALHILVKLNENTIVIKAQEFGSWKEEQIFENSIARGKQFEILVICEHTVFKIGINGQHLCEFPHKVPYHRASYIKIDGDVTVSHISLEHQPSAPSSIKQSAEMNSPPPPYGATTVPFQPAPGQPLPPQGVPSQTPYPLNGAPQTVVYTNQPAPPGQYVYNPLVQQGPPTVAALNATPRSYQNPFWSRGYYGNRKMAYIGFAIFGVFVLVGLTIFLIVFFKGQSEWDEAKKRQEEFHKKHFGDNW